MWRNFGKFWRNVGKCWDILGDFATIYALSCGEKLTKSTVISVIMPPPLDVKGGIITEKVFPVFSESFFGLVLAWSCTFGS